MVLIILHNAIQSPYTDKQNISVAKNRNKNLLSLPKLELLGHAYFQIMHQFVKLVITIARPFPEQASMIPRLQPYLCKRILNNIISQYLLWTSIFRIMKIVILPESILFDMIKVLLIKSKFMLRLCIRTTLYMFKKGLFTEGEKILSISDHPKSIIQTTPYSLCACMCPMMMQICCINKYILNRN